MTAVSMEKDFTIEGLEVTAPLDTDMYLSLEPMVNAVASSEWKSSTIFSIEDVAQAIWEHMMTEWPAYAGKDEGLVRHMARRAARKYCLAQRTQYMYATGAFLYKRYALKEPTLTRAEVAAESRAVKAITDRLNSGLRLYPVIL
jgi:hypothetical protein